MTERDLKELLRPLMPSIRAAVVEELRAADGGDPYAPEPATFSAFASAFAPHDAGKFDSYFAASEGGLYPSNLHRHFGCQPKEFADHTGLVRKQITHANGHRVWHWVRREQPPATPQTKPHAPASTPAVHELVPTPPGKLGRIKLAIADKLKQTKGGRAVLAMGSKGLKIAHAVEHRLMYASAKVGAVAAAAAVARGLAPEQADKLKNALKAADFLGGYVTGAGAVALGLPPLAIKASMFLPTASVLYLMYSTAKNPKATWKGALQVLKDTVTGAATHAAEPGASEPPPLESVAETLADLIKNGEDPDAVVAVFCAALGETKGDVSAALQMSEEALAEHEAGPDDPETFAARKDGETWTTGNRIYTRSGGKTTWKSATAKQPAAPKAKAPAKAEPKEKPAVAKKVEAVKNLESDRLPNEIIKGFEIAPNEVGNFANAPGRYATDDELTKLDNTPSNAWRDSPALVASGKAEKVNLSPDEIGQLVSTQPSVKVARVKELIDNPSAKASSDLPIVVEMDGKKLIADGHNRLKADQLMGRDSEVHLIRLDAEGNAQAPTETNTQTAKPAVAKKAAADEHHAKMKAAVAEAFADPKKLTAAKVKEVTKGLLELTAEQIKAIQVERGIKGGSAKADRVQKLIDGAKASAKAKPAPAKPKAKPEKPKPEKPKPAVKAEPKEEKSPSKSKFGEEGEGHPLAGKTYDEKLSTLGQASGSVGDGYYKTEPPSGDSADPLGYRKQGFPAHVDRAALTADMEKAMSATATKGIEFDDLYKAVGEKHGLSKNDFARAMTAMDDDWHDDRQKRIEFLTMSPDRIDTLKKDPDLATISRFGDVVYQAMLKEPTAPAAEPAKPKQAEPKAKPLDALKSALDKANTDPGLINDPAKANAYATSVVDGLKANHSPAEIHELAKALTGKKGKAKDAADSLKLIYSDLTAVSRLLESQNV